MSLPRAEKNSQHEKVPFFVDSSAAAYRSGRRGEEGGRGEGGWEGREYREVSEGGKRVKGEYGSGEIE